MNDFIKVGIIGPGRSGYDIHGKTLSKHPKYKIIAVWDSVDERLSNVKEDWKCNVIRCIKRSEICSWRLDKIVQTRSFRKYKKQS